jgi:hypothetical protein
MDENVKLLKDLVGNYLSAYDKELLQTIDVLRQQRRNTLRKIRNIEAFENSYEEYRLLITNNIDSLQPVAILKENLSDLILAPAVGGLFRNLESRLNKLKEELKNRKPFAANLTEEKLKLNKELSEIDEQLKLLPARIPDFINEVQRLVLIGEIKAKLELYTEVIGELDLSKQKEVIQELIRQLEQEARKAGEKRNVTTELLQDHIQKYISKSIALGRYRKYKAYFSEKDKTLYLRPANSTDIENVGSSSNHLFVHLCLFLGLHDFFLLKKSRHVPQFMVWDQLSRPY